MFLIVVVDDDASASDNFHVEAWRPKLLLLLLLTISLTLVVGWPRCYNEARTVAAAAAKAAAKHGRKSLAQPLVSCSGLPDDF